MSDWITKAVVVALVSLFLLAAAGPALATTATPTPVPTVPICVGSCRGGGVSIGDLVTCVNIVLGSLRLDRCHACDGDENGEVAIHELVRAVGNALSDACRDVPTVTPTPRFTPTATRDPNLFSVSGAAGEIPGGPNSPRARGVIVTLNPLGWWRWVQSLSGTFNFSAVPPGEYTLTVATLGGSPCTGQGCWEEKAISVVDRDVFVFIRMLPRATPTPPEG